MAKRWKDQRVHKWTREQFIFLNCLKSIKIDCKVTENKSVPEPIRTEVE